MTPFQQLTVWFRRASTAERATTVIATSISLALVGWLVVPVDSQDQGPEVQSVATAAGSSPGDVTSDAPVTSVAPIPTATGEADPSAAASGTPVGANRSPSATSASGGAAPTSCPAAADQGVTDSEVAVAVTIINLAGAVGNSAFAVPSPDVQEQYWRWVADAKNTKGGAACRRLKLRFYRVNPANPSEAQQQCLAIANDKPFLVLDTGALSFVGAADCIPNQKIPLVSGFLDDDQIKRYHPYYLAAADTRSNVVRTAALAMGQLGVFRSDKGFEKLGYLAQTCTTGPDTAFRSALRQAGVADDRVVRYDMGCPTGGQNNPADFQQAVLTFRQQRVTHVTNVGVNDHATFTRIASQQQYRPRYLIVDDTQVNNSSSGTLTPDPANFDGAIGVTSARRGEETTPGATPSAETKECSAIYTSHDQPPVEKQGQGYGGVICAFIAMTAALVDHAPQLKRASLIAGMHTIGKLDFSYPSGPVDFGAAPAGSGYGRYQWRPAEFSRSCACWRITDLAFRRPPA